MKKIQSQNRYVDVNGLRLHYLDWGNYDHQAMLLLHGFMGHAHVWDDFASGLRSHYHVIALDQRGHGQSQWSEDAAYAIDEHLSDIAHFIERLNLKDLILVGHSMGGRNALFYTGCRPQEVARLILVDARPGDNPEGSKALRRLLSSLPLRAKTLDRVVDAIRLLYPYLSLDICQRIAKHGYYQEQDGGFVPKYDTRMARLFERSKGTAEPLWDLMKHVACPTLIVRGEESPFLSRQEAQEMCKIIPKAEWREIPKATHMPAQENPSAFKRVVLEFIGL